MMKKYISILSCFMGSVLLGLTACSDEVTPLPSLPEEGEPVGVTLTLYIPQAEQVVVTRADADEDAVNELCLLVFPSAEDEAVLEQAQTFTSGDLTDVDGTRKQFKVTLEASSEEKYLYVVANASSLLSGAIEKGKTTLGEVRTLTTDADQAPFVMSGRVQSKIPDVKLVTQDIPLIRTVAQLTMEDESDNGRFIYTGFALYGRTTEGSLLAGADSQSEGYTPSPGSEDNHSAIGNTPLYTYPCLNEGKLFLIVQGTYGGQPCYYRAAFEQDGEPLDIWPNHHYAIHITQVDRMGYTDLETAVAAADDNMEVGIRDYVPEITDMATDGYRELGVSDTVKITTGEAQTTALFYVKYTPPVTDQYPQLTWESGEDWLELAENGPEVTQEDEYTLYTYTLTTTRANLSGEQLTARIRVEMGGFTRYVVVQQTPDFRAHEFGTVALTVQEREDAQNGSFTVQRRYDDYWAMLRGNTEVWGISPEAMGGKVRTEGFHFPMSDYQQFVYTFTVPTGDTPYGQVTAWRVELDEAYRYKLLFWNGSEHPTGGDSNIAPSSATCPDGIFTFTNDLVNYTMTREDAYNVGKDAFRIVLTLGDGSTVRVSYDLYHTGIFHKYDGSSYEVGSSLSTGWYYYEVIRMGNRYWLDRNLGATSAGYSIRGDDGFTTGGTSWPLLDTSAGGWFRVVQSVSNNEPDIPTDLCPKSFRVPYMSDFNDLIADSRFEMAYVVETGGNYWSAHYQSPHGTFYFPKNRMYSGEVTGDAHAGYYWTQTPALGASGGERGWWLQFMKFSGSNASADRRRIQDKNDWVGMSLRCVYGTREIEEKVYTIEFYVKGYTHVYLYNEEADGTRTYLNAWPGDMVTIYSEAKEPTMSHVFTYQSVTEYRNLRAVFNVVDEEGNVVISDPTDYQTNGGVQVVDNKTYERLRF